MAQIEYARKPLAIGLALLVVVTYVTAAAMELASSGSEIVNWTSDQAAVLEQNMKDAVDEVIADVEAVAAFVEEIGADPASFASFTSRIGGTDSAIGYGFLTAVAASEIDEFIESQKAIHGDWYTIFGFPDDPRSDDDLEFADQMPTDLTSRDVFYPVQAFAVGSVIRSAIPSEPIEGRVALGLDAGFDPRWRADIASAISRAGPTISQFISLQISALRLDRVFFVSVPVARTGKTGKGMVMAMMLEPLLVEELNQASTQGITWEIVPEGAVTGITSSHVQTFPVELPGATWTVAIAPTEATLAHLRGLPWWAVAGIASSLVFLAALAAWLYFDRRTEHRRVSQFRRLADDKDRFLASVSHELRTPLTVVSGLAYELNEQPESFSTTERADLMGMLVEQTDELTGIVEDLLIAARSDIAKVAIHNVDVNLGDLANQAIATSGVQASLRGVPGHAHADPQRVRQILRNLLTNAKRYGGSRVRIDFAEGSGWTEVSVADNGDGVPAVKRETIFQSYESAHRPRSTVSSVGLGLYISRNLARAMGGDLEYAYDGSWSHFRLRLRSASSAPTLPTVRENATV